MTPLARLVEDQPEGFVDEPSVSGRSYLREAPLPEDFRHDVRFRGAFQFGSEDAEVVAYCEPCSWSVRIAGGHDLGDLIRLCAQHAGVPDVTISTTETLADLLKAVMTP